MFSFHVHPKHPPIPMRLYNVKNEENEKSENEEDEKGETKTIPPDEWEPYLVNVINGDIGELVTRAKFDFIPDIM